MDEALLGKHGKHLLDVFFAKALVFREWQLEGRTLHVIEQDVQVVRIDQRVLGRRIEEIRRIAHHELVNRCAAGDEHRRRAGTAPACPAGALPGGRDRPRIPRHHGDVERADIDAQFEGVG